MSFKLDDPTKLHDEAQKRAFESARAKAQKLAKLAGLKLGRALSIQEHVVGAGDSLADAEELGEVFYGRGIVISAILAEGIRVAQEMHGTGEISAAQLRDGLASLNFTEARIEELGLTGMMAPFSTSCADHTGHSGAWMIQWDGTKFVQASDLLKADRAAIEPLEAEKAAEYAEANAPWPMNEACEG